MLLKQLALFSITAKWNTEEPLFTFVFIGILPNWNSPDTPPYTNRNKIRLISYFSFDSVPVWCRRFLNYSLPAFFDFSFLWNLVNTVVWDPPDIWVRLGNLGQGGVISVCSPSADESAPNPAPLQDHLPKVGAALARTSPKPRGVCCRRLFTCALQFQHVQHSWVALSAGAAVLWLPHSSAPWEWQCFSIKKKKIPFSTSCKDRFCNCELMRRLRSRNVVKWGQSWSGNGEGGVGVLRNM